MTPDPSRRAVLASVGGALAAGLAGCSEVSRQEFAAAPVELPEAVSEGLRLPEVFADSQTSTYERTIGDEDVEVAITNQFAGYQRTPPIMDSGWWVKARPSLVERFVGFDPRSGSGDLRSGSGSAINVVASDLGIDEVHPEFVEGDTPITGSKITWVVPERARYDGEVDLDELLAVHHAEALGVEELTSRGGNNYLVEAPEVLPDREFFPAGWSDWTPDGRWVVGRGKGWMPDEPSSLRCLVCLGEQTPESRFGIEEMPGRRLEEGESIETAGTLVLSPAPKEDPGPAFPLEPAEVFDAGYPTPMGGPSYGLGVIATPNAEIAGESVNPLARIELRDLLTGDTTGDVLARAGLTDADGVEWLRGPEQMPGSGWASKETVTVLGEEVGIESFGGVVSGAEGPWAVAIHAAKAAGDDVVFPAAVHRRPVGTPDGRELFGDGTGFLDRRWTTRALELTAEVFASLVAIEET